MHYYKRHLGDYAKDTGHLSALEHGVYTLLLDWYYANERPIPPDKATRIARGNPEETQTVLSEFFKLSDEGWTHSYADRVIAEYNVKAERNREVGRLGGRPKPKANPEETQTVSKSNPEITLAISHKPLTIKDQKKEHASPSGSRLPADWSLPPEWRAWAVQERPDVDVAREADGFADYWRGVAGAKARKADWQATWRNWIRRADGMRSRQPQQPGKRMQAIMRLEAMKNGLGNAGNHHGDSEALLLGSGPGAGFGTGRGNGSGMG